MKGINITTTNNHINIENDNNISTNKTSSYEMDSFEIENPLLLDDYGKKESSDNVNCKNNVSKKIAYPPNACQTLSFSWVYDIVKKSKKNKHLEFSYLGEVSSNYKSEKIFQEIETKWYGKYYFLLKKLKEMKKRSIYPLFMTLITANYWRIIFSLILYMAIGILDFIGVFMFRALLSNFKDNKDTEVTKSKEDEIDVIGMHFLKNLSLTQIIILMILYKIVTLILNRQTQFISDLISVRTTTQLNLLIYDKLLKIPTFNMGKFNEGKIINLFQIDSESFGEFIINTSLIVLVPFKIIYSSYLLVIYFKFAFIPGIMILIVLAVLFCIFGHKQKVYHKECMKATDERMNITSKTFDIIKMIKLYSWEKIFKSKINEKRKIELNANYKKIKLQIIVATIYWTVENFLCMTCISFYNIFYQQMDVENILTALYVIHGLVESLFCLPSFFVSLFETVVSLIRIQNFLSIKNHDYSQIEYVSKEAYSKYSIEISNVDFGVERIVDNNRNVKDVKKINYNNRNEDINSIKNDNCTSIEMVNLQSKENEEKLDEEKLDEEKLDEEKLDEEKSDEEKLDKEKSDEKKLDDISIKKNIKSEKKEELNEKAENKEKNEIKENTKINDSDLEKIKNVIQDEPKKYERITLLRDINVKILKGEHIGIIGEVGSGKTCLLNAFINNLQVFSKNNEIGNIKLSGKVSFVSQNPWILNTTVEENILFFNEKNEERYKKIVSICQLEQDFNSLPKGDKTEIGEKGVNLSGGQKARISIARAIYDNAEIYIFDDPLSALDAYVGMKLFKAVFTEFLKEKTFIISTHALQYLCFFDRIFYMKHGKIEWMGSYKEIEEQEFYEEFVDSIQNSKSKNENDDEKDGKNKDDVNNSEDEDSEKNGPINVNKPEENKPKVSLSTYITLIKFSGGLKILIKILLPNIVWKALQIYSDYYLSSWSSLENLKKEQNNIKLIIYLLISLPIILSVILRQKYMGDAYMNFNIKMHDLLIEKLINAPINLFHDITPSGHIITRLSKDLNNSARINNIVSGILRMGFQVLGSIILCIYFNIWTLPVIIIILSLEVFFSYYSLKPIKDISRLEGYYRAPLIGVFSETLSGLNIIRSAQYEDNFINKFNKKMNDYFKICIFQSGISGWYGIILDMISFGLLSFILISCLLCKEKYSPQSIGLLLTYSLNIIKQLFNLMGRFSGLNRMLISVERCENYTKIVQEKYPNLATDKNLKQYPSFNGKDTTFILNGKINFKDYSVKYRPNTPLVLKNLTFEIKPKEKIGVVGRTGSGKSTLCLSLFRLLEPTSGKISIDGINISEIGLEMLRKNLTIIPQEPILIGGSLRKNIDPYNLYTDKEIIDILSEVGFDEFFLNRSLDYEIEDNGINISIGEKQLICIARALLKKTKIILMDEATANIDYKTESFLQNCINQGMKDSTVITIAHRIKTIINYDKILVLNNGEIVELDSPKNLLIKKGLFYHLYKESLL